VDRFSLLVFDFAIARSAFEQLSARTKDILTLLAVIPILVFLARQAIADLPAERAQWIAIGMGALASFSIFQFATMRMRYHQSVGPVAGDALSTANAATYVASLVCAGALLLLLITLLLGLLWPVHLMMGAFAGTAFVILWLAASKLFASSNWLPGLALPLWFRPNAASWQIVSGLGVAFGALLALVPLPDGGLELTSASLTLGAALLWGNAKAQTVKFMSLVGQPTLTIATHFVVRPLAFSAPLAAMLWAFVGSTPALIVGAVLLGSLWINALRVAAYLLYRRQVADWVVTIILAGVAMVAFSFPFAAPVFAVVAFAWLAARARRSAWMIP
jgi:hypothetical protein